MSGLEQEDEWDTEEFQTALKIVLKYEIQSLLERLSYHGEETVLLTANKDDNCVGHLASTNAQRFVDSKDVGDLKTKFLSFLTGSDKHAALRQIMPAATAAFKNNRGNVQSGNHPQPRGSYTGPATGGRPAVSGQRGTDHDAGTVSDSEVISRRLDNVQQASGQLGKVTAKRPLEDISVSKDKNLAQPLSPKRRKTENLVAPSPQTTGIKPMPVTAPSGKQGTKHVESVTQFPASRAGQPVQQKGDIKLNTTKVVSKSGFVEERLSQAEFQKILQQYKHSDTAGHDEDYDDEEEEEDYDEEDEYNEMLEEGEIQFPYLEQKVFSQQKPTGQNQSQGKGMAVVPKTGNAIINANTTTPTAQAGGKQLDSESAKKLSQVSQSPASSKANSATTPTAGSKSVTSVSGKKVCDDSKAPDNRDDKEHDGNTKTVKKGTEQSQVKATGKDSMSEQRLKEEGVKDKSGNTPKPEGKPQATAGGQPNKRFSDNVDDMDTESLIKMVKEQHAKSQSDADKQIQAKLGQLSSKLSWVVEYPKDGSQGEHPNMPMPNMMFPPGMGHGPGGYMDDEEEEDEDYDEEDFDEDELDDQDRAALAYMRKMAEQQRTSAVPPERPGHFEGVIGDDEHFEDYDQEMEGFDEHHRMFNPAEQMGMPAERMGMPAEQMGMPADYQNEGEDNHGAAATQPFQVYKRSSSPSLDNFLLMGPSMAKCLVCNKIIRKTEIRQHNKTHEDEGAGEEEGEEEGEEFEGEEEGGEEGHEMGEDYDEEGEEYPEEGEEDMGEDMNLAEFTAEPLVAERLDDVSPSDAGSATKGDKTTVCDICNKNFKSNGNVARHKKLIHGGNQDVKCLVCDRTFKHKQYMLKHLKNKHPDYEAQGGTGAGADGDGGTGAEDGGADEGREKEKLTTNT